MLRDGQDSANLLGQESFESNKTDWNFFSPFFSHKNEIKDTRELTQTEKLFDKFAEATEYVFNLGLRDAAEID